MKVAIVGCGFIGEKRAKALRGQHQIVACYDTNLARAQALAAKYPGAVARSEWQPDESEVVCVATVHKALPEMMLAAVSAGKHVLVEKPAARRAAELDAVVEACARTGALVRIGFNHRHHRAFRKMREIVDSGVLGKLLFVRARYGHGGRIGYDKEWRAVPELSGGGEAIDQGLHLVDLARWFLGDFPSVKGEIATYFWDMPVEDNAFFLLKTSTGQVASLHATWTEWKNTFSFELTGQHGKLEVSGLGGSYGLERLAYYQMLPEMGPPPTTVWEFPMADDSWEDEFDTFLEDIRLQRTPNPGLADAQAALRIVEEVYGQS